MSYCFADNAVNCVYGNIYIYIFRRNFYYYSNSVAIDKIHINMILKVIQLWIDGLNMDTRWTSRKIPCLSTEIKLINYASN